MHFEPAPPDPARPEPGEEAGDGDGDPGRPAVIRSTARVRNAVLASALAAAMVDSIAQDIVDQGIVPGREAVLALAWW